MILWLHTAKLKRVFEDEWKMGRGSAGLPVRWQSSSASDMISAFSTSQLDFFMALLCIVSQFEACVQIILKHMLSFIAKLRIFDQGLYDVSFAVVMMGD